MFQFDVHLKSTINVVPSSNYTVVHIYKQTSKSEILLS